MAENNQGTMIPEKGLASPCGLMEDIGLFLEECRQLGRPPLIVVLGPTASGKTALSIKIAKAFDGEVVSADSRQIYKHMDIGTEKVTEAEKEGIPHYLIDVVSPNEDFSLAEYKRAALKVIGEILRRRKVPILCGGTGLYINAIVDNYQIPHVPPQFDLRQELARYCEQHGVLALHDLLKERDPEAAAKIHPNNVRYVIRALEINLSGGDKKREEKGDQMFNVFSVGVDWPREDLYDRINRRVDSQLDRGLLNEVKTLMMRGYGSDLPSLTSIGYAEIISYLKGETDLQSALENIKKNTRNYAKRQLTWFRHNQGVRWITPGDLNQLLMTNY
ncbi:MAG TPA: tRNA (adenosine(37)-N6)-dimethylallyltransferase MiaA [Candidatus Gracilibacteria bacterium]|nr:tRNA (adenosine(37)-N6)-dimethylallyltransferase MiaA [Candidatus Gracilibacteria bacterium]HRY90807.1 tRNA (adenosine(37)-N6)-dimethylallyltransferase MiaA [Candidatus Gracilibacteria bacterium]